MRKLVWFAYVVVWLFSALFAGSQSLLTSENNSNPGDGKSKFEIYFNQIKEDNPHIKDFEQRLEGECYRLPDGTVVTLGFNDRYGVLGKEYHKWYHFPYHGTLAGIAPSPTPSPIPTPRNQPFVLANYQAREASGYFTEEEPVKSNRHVGNAVFVVAGLFAVLALVFSKKVIPTVPGGLASYHAEQLSKMFDKQAEVLWKLHMPGSGYAPVRRSPISFGRVSGYGCSEVDKNGVLHYRLRVVKKAYSAEYLAPDERLFLVVLLQESMNVLEPGEGRSLTFEAGESVMNRIPSYRADNVKYSWVKISPNVPAGTLQ